MSRFKFLHAADLHLDSPLRGLEADAPAERIRDASRRALENLVALALEEQVAFVLLAGDLYDGDWEDWPTGHFLISQIAKLTRANIPVYAIRGNHDAQSVLTKDLPWPPGAHLFGTTGPQSHQVPGMDVMVHGHSFAHRAVTENIALAYPAPVTGMLNIGLLHTACGADGAHETYAPSTPQQLAGHGYDYWALGHIHQRATLNGHPAWVVYPGNLQGRHINEEGPKGATLVHVDGRTLTPEHRTLDAVRWARIGVDLAGVATQEAAGDRIRAALLAGADAAEGRLLAARISLRGATPLHSWLAQDPGATHERIRAIAAAAGLEDELWIEQIDIVTRLSVDLSALRDGADGMALLLRTLEEAPSDAVAAEVAAYAGKMLGKAPRLREALGPEHVAVRALASLPPDLVQRARDLVLARLAEG